MRLKAIRERKNSLRSDNILSLINAAPQTWTISNPLSQSPSASPPRPFQKAHQIGRIQLIFCTHPIRSVSPTKQNVKETGWNGEVFEKTNRNTGISYVLIKRIRNKCVPTGNIFITHFNKVNPSLPHFKSRNCRRDTSDWMHAENQSDSVDMMHLSDQAGL